MIQIPHAKVVSQGLQSVRAAARRSLKGLNQAAGLRMAKGDYVSAEAMAAKGREIRQFLSEVEVLRKRWSAVFRAGGGKPKGCTTPLWTYYQPILKVLADLGGVAPRSDFESAVERLMGATLQPPDREPLGRGTERWRVMIRRAHKHLVDEGWIEGGSGKAWRITDTGRRAAEKPIDPARRSID